jgi:hypothetical protein
MMETSAQCALPGCDRTVEPHSGGGPQAKYCSREHSVEARRRRQIARAESTLESVAPAEAEPAEAEPAVRSVPAVRKNSERRRWLIRTGVAVVLLAAVAFVGPASALHHDTPVLAAAPYTAAAPTSSRVAPITPAEQAAPVVPPPVPPTGLTATPGDGYVELCWQPVAGATAYVAYHRDVTKAEDWQRMPYPITDHCWMSGQLWNNHTYEFRFVASNSGGESAFSDVVQATPSEPKPGVPGGLTASPGDGQARLCWKAAPNADMYIMYHRDVTAAEPWTRAQYPITSGLCLTAHLLTNGHLYQFRFTASNSNGESAYSDVAQVTPAATLPAVPTGLTTTPGSGRVLLCWQPAAHANAYVAYYRDTTTGQDWVTMPYPIQNGTCWNADQLWNNHTYQFRLKASNNAGQSGFSTVVTATPV